MKAETIIGALALIAGIAAAVWTFKRLRGTATPARSDLYHAANNPNGYVWLPEAGAYARTLPSGVTEYWT